MGISADMLKVTLEKHLPLMTKIVNLSFEMYVFQTIQNFSAFRKNDCLDKENYRSDSVSFNVSEVFERITYSQIDY